MLRRRGGRYKAAFYVFKEHRKGFLDLFVLEEPHFQAFSDERPEPFEILVSPFSFPFSYLGHLFAMGEDHLENGIQALCRKGATRKDGWRPNPGRGVDKVEGYLILLACRSRSLDVITIGFVDGNGIGEFQHPLLIPCSSSPAPAIISTRKKSTIEATVTSD